MTNCEKLRRDAADWLVEHGPGQSAVVECKARFGLTAKDLAVVCRSSSEIRSQRTREGAA